MADEPCPELGGLTPVEAAHTPAMDELARKGRNGLLATVPDGFSPGSEIAHLSLLGYDVPTVYEGRGVLEAASMGVDIEPGELALRCNLICIAPDGTIKNHSAGHLSTEEAAEIIKTLNEELGDGRASFYPGVSYRNLLKVKEADKRIVCVPPHDVPGHYASDEMIRAKVEEATETADYINRLILKSQKILANHPVNLKRIAQGKDPANSIWPWSPGYKPAMKTMKEMFGIDNGVVISAVDLIMGIGVYAGLKPIIVEGATGLHDTNYEGKVTAALDALRGGADFVFLHIEASDDAGHEGDIDLKVKTIENLDHRVVTPVLKFLEDFDEDVVLALLPDHPTPCHLRTHTACPVPFVIWKKHLIPDDVSVFSERAAASGAYSLLKYDKFIHELII